MDWADELADLAINGAGRILCGQELNDRIAIYLRKAKASGYEKGFIESGQILSEAANGLFIDLLKDPEIIAKVSQRASQIEVGLE